MAHHLLFSSTLLILLSVAAMQQMQGSHAVEYAVKDNSGNTYGGDRFRKEIGVEYSLQTMDQATHFIWTIFQQPSSGNRKAVPNVTLFIENRDGIAFVENNRIHVSANYLGSYCGDVKTEFTGVLYHSMTHIWQWNGAGQAPVGLIEGIADFVRLRANYIPSHWVKPGQGCSWDQGFDVTALFLDYCNSLRNEFVAELNEKMRTGYNNGYFVDLLGKTVDQLWSDYKAKYKYGN